MVHFGFEMADEFTRNTFPFRFTIPPASLDPSVPRPEMDFSEKSADRQGTLSQDDLQFLKMEEGIRQTADGHYEMPLPFRGNTPKLPNNKSLALRCLNKLKTRMENDVKYRQDYMTFMQDIIRKGFAERVPHEQGPDDDGKSWYIPHHGVYHP